MHEQQRRRSSAPLDCPRRFDPTLRAHVFPLSPRGGVARHGQLLSFARARVTTYRAAMVKRLDKLDQAEPELRKALDLLNRHDLMDTDEAHDTRDNLAGVLALKGEASEAIDIVRALRGPPYAAAICAHREDYVAASTIALSLSKELPTVEGTSPRRLRTPGHPPDAAR
jgi:hypothetical protein